MNEQMVRDLAEALIFYADPESYFAVGFWFDRPCGDFAEDFDGNHNNSMFDRDMPGAKAREVLRRYYDDIVPLLEESE